MLVEENTETKVCTKCGEEKPLGEYPRAKQMKDGHRNECRECVRKAHKQWRDRSPTYTATQRKYREVHKEAYAGYCATYRKAHPDRPKKSQAKWRSTHRDQKRAEGRAYWTQQIVALGDVYVKQLLRNRGFSPEQKTSGLIKAQRALILLKRAIKQTEEGQ